MTFLSMGCGKTVYLRQNFFKNSNFFQKSLKWQVFLKE